MALILISTKKGTSYNRVTDTEYVYENSTYYNDETGKKEYKRKLVGKIDRKTGEEISTGSVGRPRADRPTYGVAPEQELPAKSVASQDMPVLSNVQIRALLESVQKIEDEFATLRQVLDAALSNEQ